MTSAHHTTLVVYGKTDCSQCTELLELLANTATDVTYLTLDIDYTREELMNIKPANVRTFPVSFIFDGENYTYISNADIPSLINKLD